MQRTMDAGFLNRVANDASVRPHIGGGDVGIDLTATLADPKNVALVNEHGGFVFVQLEPHRYELHTLFLPEGRGASVLPAFAEAARHLFTTTDAGEIVTKAPEPNRAALLMARRAGFRLLFSRPDAWGAGQRVDFLGFTIDDWLAADPAIEAEGRAFHEMLEAAKAAKGSDRDTHPDDPAHDRAAGAAVLMAKAGNAAKGVWTYNRWAAFAGYQTVELINAAPAVIDVRDAVIGVNAGQLEVLLCR